MKAILTQPNFKLSIEDVPYPAMGDDEIIMDVHAAGLNRADLLQREGKYPSPEGCPPWMGLEVAGSVAAMGKSARDKSGFSVGDRVCALLGGGGYAQHVSVRYDMALSAPANLTVEECAAIPEAYTTAYLNLIKEAGLKEGETAFIFAGASGVGIAAIQLCQIKGARAIASVRDDRKAAFLRQLGADIVINTRTQSATDCFEANGVDVVLDCVGGSGFGACFEKLNRYGRWVAIANLAGARSEINLNALVFRGLRLMGSTLRSRTPEVKARALKDMSELFFPYFEKGVHKPVIHEVFDFTDVEKAQEVLQNNRNTGKVILKMR